MEKENLLTTIGETTEYGRLYLEQEKDLLKLEVAEKIAATTSSLISLAVISLLSLVAFLFFSLTAGLYLAQLLGSYPLAFLIVSMSFLLLAIGVYFFRNRMVTRPIYTLISDEILGEHENKESLKMTSEITRQEFARSIGTNQVHLKKYLLKRVGLPLGIVGGMIGGKAMFSSDDQSNKPSKTILKNLLPLFINFATAYFVDKKAEEVADETVYS